MKPNKEEKYHTQLTAGGYHINYPDNVGTPAADMTLFKCLMISIILTPGARCITVEIKDFYLCTSMKCSEYMRLKTTDIPKEIMREYKLQESVTQDGYVYCKITKGMYGLPQAGIKAQELLKKRLAEYGHHQSKIIPGLSTHETRPTTFTLAVDDFIMKIISEKDADHLINVLKKHCIITVDKEATKYIGLAIKWDYAKGKVHTLMPGYLPKMMMRFKHETPNKIQNSPHRHVETQYGKKAQFTTVEEDSPLKKEETKYVHAVAGTLLYYARAVNPTIIPTLSAIRTEQAKPTQATIETIKQLLNYCATQEEAIITYSASKMILCVHSNAGYCNEKKAQSQAGGHFFLSNNDQLPPNNGAIMTNATIIKAVISSAAEAELGALFLNAKEVV
jgi:hypothetical protein